MESFRDKRITVAGLGRFGGNFAAARWLAEQGAKVLVTDKEPAEKLGESPVSAPEDSGETPVSEGA